MSEQSKYTTQLSIVEPTLYDEPEVRWNDGRGRRPPFSVVDLAPGMWLYIHEAAHARVIAAAFTKAADLLDDHASEQAAREEEPPAKPAASVS